ncbi:MAG: AAA family ATPase [Limnobacter sp.]|nr:AAA family ATPase [Limnobacter sp.]
MLNNLTISDFVIVSQLELNFQAGMSVLSGETGAGKSILIDALSLCLGARADVSQIREGCERATITAVFACNLQAEAILREQAIESETELHLRRTIDTKGKSKAFVNGVPVPAATLRQLAETLIDIHGQHAFQTLAKPAQQLELLDSFGNYQPMLAEVASVSQALAAAQKSLTKPKPGWKNARQDWKICTSSWKACKILNPKKASGKN